MWEVLSRKKRHHLQLMCILSSLVFIVWACLPVSAASAAVFRQQAKSATCPSPVAPTSQSQLVVMLDRSGSLDATDPDRYSTSVTKALTDLWPGSMVVVFFSKDQAQKLGPVVLSDPAQRAKLQQEIENYPIGGETPLGPAMHTARDTLKAAKPGSRAMIITDGQPNTTDDPGGAKQSKDIRDNLIGQFCQQGIPVTPFGLTLDQNDPAGKDANQLLTDIANGTGTTYTNVTGAKDLAGAVISLYAQWQNLTFTQASNQGGSFPVAIDTFAKQVQIVTFRSSNRYQVALDGPDGQPIQGIQTSDDKHYVISTLTQGVFVPGSYTVYAQGDPDAQVYALVNSPLQIKISKPTEKEQFYDQPVAIEASFFNGTSVLTPGQGQAQLIAHVTLMVNGQPVGAANDVVLVQQGAVFKGQTQAYTRTGEVTIEIKGSYQGVQRQTVTSLQLVPPPPPPCTGGPVSCLWQQYHSQIVTYGPLLLLLLLLLFYLTRPGPFGILESVESSSNWKVLGTGRNLGKRLWSKSKISSSELGSFEFEGALFSLRFKQGKRAYIQARSDAPPLAVKDDGGTHEVKRNKSVQLTDGAVISVAGSNVVTFKTRHEDDQKDMDWQV